MAASDPEWDVIVVGAGQAGSAAAYDLAATGARVLIIERSAFPRVKPCAGGVTVKALNRLRFPITAVVREVVRDMAISADGRAARVIGGPSPILAMTVRAELDSLCLDRAVQQGCQLSLRSERIIAAEQSGDRVTLRYASGDALTARFLIAADGANSTVRRVLGLAPLARAFALEGHLPMALANTRRMSFDFGAVKGGYGWIFPKGDHLNIGLYTQSEGAALSKEALRRYARSAAGSDALEAIAGHPLNVDGHGQPRAFGRVLFAGDAAGSCERLLGEGIHNAIRSGQAAAAAILASRDNPDRAAHLLSADLFELDRDVSACSRAAGWFYASAGLRRAALTIRPVSSAFRSGFAAGLTFRQIALSAPFYRFYAARPIAALGGL